MSTREADVGTDLQLPEAGTYAVDPGHASVEFVGRHLMLAKVRGNFSEFTGAIHVGETPEKSSFEATVMTSSIDTRQEQRDEHLKSPDFLDVEKFPEMTYKSTSVTPAGAGKWRVSGELTVKDTTRPVELEVEYNGTATDPWGGRRIGFSARGEVDREAFGMTWNQTLEAGGVLVGRKVGIEIEAEAVHQ